MGSLEKLLKSFGGSEFAHHKHSFPSALARLASIPASRTTSTLPRCLLSTFVHNVQVLFDEVLKSAGF